METAVEQWIVRLPSSHPNYSVIKFRRSEPGNQRYRVVVVDTQEFMRCVKNDIAGYVVPEAGTWSKEKLTKIHEFLDPSSGVPEMPVVHFATSQRRKRVFGITLFGLFGVERVGAVGFTNGRHRSRYMEYAEAKAFPVEVEVDYADELEARCGIRLGIEKEIVQKVVPEVADTQYQLLDFLGRASSGIKAQVLQSKHLEGPRNRQVRVRLDQIAGELQKLQLEISVQE